MDHMGETVDLGKEVAVLKAEFRHIEKLVAEMKMELSKINSTLCRLNYVALAAVALLTMGKGEQIVSLLKLLGV